jgi:hypothetical protein
MRTAGTLRCDVNVKKVLVILVVIVVVLTGIPLVMAGPVMCPDCGPAVASAFCLLGVLGLAAFAVQLLVSRIRRPAALLLPLLLGVVLDPPPRVT